MLFKITAYTFFIHAVLVFILEMLLIYIGVFDSATPQIESDEVPVHWLILVWMCVWPYWVHYLMVFGSVAGGISFLQFSVGKSAKVLIGLWAVLLILPNVLYLSGYYILGQFGSSHYHSAIKGFWFGLDISWEFSSAVERILYALIPIGVFGVGLIIHRLFSKPKLGE